MEEAPEKSQNNETRISQDVSSGQQPPAVVDVYERLRQLRGKIRFSRTWAELKEDRKTLTDPTQLREMFEDLEDYFLAARVLERVRNGEEGIHSSAEMRAELGLADT